MVGADAPVPLPSPRRSVEVEGSWERVRWWYEEVLGWPTVPPGAGDGVVRLRTGVRFDVLGVPVEAGRVTLERLGARAGFPVAVRGERMLLLVAAGAAEEVPALLEWLEWGSLPLGLTAVGAGGTIEAPLPARPWPARSAGPPSRPPGRDGPPGTARWLRPPEPEDEVESSLPALSALGGAGTALDLARLVHTLATQCHRVRLSPVRPVAGVG